MDLNPLDPKAAHTAAGGARRGNSGDSGFRGVMELMAHLTASDRQRADEIRRPAEESGSRTERPARAAKSSDADDARPTAKAAHGRRQTETETDNHSGELPILPSETRQATASTAAATGNQGSASAIVPTAGSETDVDGAPMIPASTPVPSRVGVPADGKSAPAASASAVPATAAGQPAPQQANAQTAGYQGAATGSPALQTSASQEPAAGATNPQTATAEPQVDQAAIGQPKAGQPQVNQPQAGPGPVAQTQVAQTQVAQSQMAQSRAAPAQGSAPQPPTADQQTAAVAVETAPRPTKDKPATLPGDAKVSVEPGTVVARTQGVSSAVLVQAHLTTASDTTGKAGGLAGQGLAGQGLAEQSLANQGLASQGLTGQAATASSAQPLHVGGSQALFVGADAGSGQSGAQSGGGQNGDGGQAGQNGGQSQTGGQAQAGGGFAFGAATIGQRGFGGDAARAQFQEILSTRTARAPMQGSGATTPGGTTPLSFTAGPGGPQSTLTTAMASRAEATAQGRPGALASTAVGQVAMKLAGTAADGGGRVTIRLNPEELGKLDIKLEFSRDGSIRAQISAERPETLDMLQRDARALDKALQEAGLKTDQNSLEFNLQGENGQPGGSDDEQTAAVDDGLSGPENADNDEVDTASLPDAGGARADGSYDLVA